MTEAGLQVRLLRYSELNPAIVACWELLGERALEPNPFLSPCFIIPTLRHLCSETDVRNTVFVFVEQPNSTSIDLVGAGVFVRSRGELRFPLSHLKSFRSIHSYLSGILLDREKGEKAVRAMFQFLRRNDARWHGLDFACMPADGVQAELMFRVASEFGCAWHERERTARALFVPAEAGDAYLQANLSARRLKKLRQTRRRLEAIGRVEWRTLFGTEVTESSVESFLDLEHKGWKAGKGMSLRSKPSHEAFFRELVDNFRRSGRIFFTELLLDGAVIASTSNLVAGDAGFAFKIGWHPDYADTSPGLLNEVAFVRGVTGPCRDLSYVDSGAEEGSFIEHLWAGRRALTHGTFSTSAAGRVALVLYDRLRRCKMRLKSFRGRHSTGSQIA